MSGLKTTPQNKAEAKKIRESQVEKYLKDRAVARGGKSWKWTGGNGVPDRIVMLNGNVAFVEVKRPFAVPRESQIAQHERMQRCGVHVFVVDRYEMVDALLELMLEKQGNGGVEL